MKRKRTEPKEVLSKDTEANAKDGFASHTSADAGMATAGKLLGRRSLVRGRGSRSDRNGESEDISGQLDQYDEADGGQTMNSQTHESTDQSAKRKSPLESIQQTYNSGFSYDDDDLGQEQDMAHRIRVDDDSEAEEDDNNNELDQNSVDGEADREVPNGDTPKRRPGRPKGYRKPRTPTPPRHFPSYYHYFFQNRPKGSNTSNNSLSSLSLISHEDYFKLMNDQSDHHELERQFLHNFHSRSFNQWNFELSQGYNVCLYGWGSKRGVLNAFARHTSISGSTFSQIVVINGYNTSLAIRDILETLSGVIPSIAGSKSSYSPLETASTVLSALDSTPPAAPILLMVNSMDGSSLRRPATQSCLSLLASSPHIQLIASVDNPQFPLMWSHGLLAQFNWVFHDCTTFQAYDVEISCSGRSSVVDEVNNLIGRSNRKLQGREGVMYVLRSLTANARNLYALLLGEILSVAVDGPEDDPDGLMDGDDSQTRYEPWLNQYSTVFENQPESKTPALKKQFLHNPKPNIPTHTLYSRAVSQLITTNEINYRALLKEFYDHEMITSQRDAFGSEILGVPFRKDEIETILADLVNE